MKTLGRTIYSRATISRRASNSCDGLIEGRGRRTIAELAVEALGHAILPGLSPRRSGVFPAHSAESIEERTFTFIDSLTDQFNPLFAVECVDEHLSVVVEQTVKERA